MRFGRSVFVYRSHSHMAVGCRCRKRLDRRCPCHFRILESDESFLCRCFVRRPVYSGPSPASHGLYIFAISGGHDPLSGYHRHRHFFHSEKRKGEPWSGEHEPSVFSGRSINDPSLIKKNGYLPVFFIDIKTKKQEDFRMSLCYTLSYEK